MPRKKILRDGPCSVDGCDRPAKYATTGWCQAHYHRWWRTGSLDILPKPVRDDPTYRGAHSRVNALHGSAKNYPCIECGEEAREWAYDGTDPDELDDIAIVDGVEYPVSYSAWPEFYMPMCFGCHRLRDRSARGRQTHCWRGHEMTPENIYSPPSRPREYACRTCRAEDGRRRYRARKAARGPLPPKPKRTHCRNGHEMTPENTYLRPDRPGAEECRTCKSDSNRRVQERKSNRRRIK